MSFLFFLKSFRLAKITNGPKLLVSAASTTRPTLRLQAAERDYWGEKASFKVSERMGDHELRVIPVDLSSFQPEAHRGSLQHKATLPSYAANTHVEKVFLSSNLHRV